MRITIINHSDTRGGASIVSMRLMHALRDLGIDARMLVMHKESDSPWVEELQPAWKRKIEFLAECAYIYTHNDFSRKKLFQASTGRFGMTVHNHPLVVLADAIILGWVNQGTLSLDEIAKIKAPVLWNMHDMWCLTGVCHHAHNCPGYRNACGNCPLLHKNVKEDEAGRPVKHAKDLSNKVLCEKQALYASKKITFVPVSKWLEHTCKISTLLKSQSIITIPNAFPVEEFYTVPKKTRAELGFPDDKKLVIMGAARLDDPIKGLDMAVAALNHLKDTNIAAVFFGELRDPHALDKLYIPYRHLGSISDPDTLHDIYAASDIVLSSSHYETLPGTLIEGMASGCFPVAFDHGGQSDIITHKHTGYLARYPYAYDLAQGIRFALDRKIDREMLRNDVKDKFSARTIAIKYTEVISKIIS